MANDMTNAMMTDKDDIDTQARKKIATAISNKFNIPEGEMQGIVDMFWEKEKPEVDENLLTKIDKFLTGVGQEGAYIFDKLFAWGKKQGGKIADLFDRQRVVEFTPEVSAEQDKPKKKKKKLKLFYDFTKPHGGTNE